MATTQIKSGTSDNQADVNSSKELLVSDAGSHTDLAQIDADLVAFKDANHTDLTVVQGKQDTGNTSLSSIDSKLNTLGQKAMAGSMPVVLSSDQIASATPGISRVSASVTSVQLLAANTARKGAIFVNDSASNCYVKFGTTASATSYTFLMTGSSTLILEEFPIYTGGVDAIWVTATGAMQITELT